MFTHVVMMRFNAPADADPEVHCGIEAYAERVRRECAGLVQYDYTANLASRAKGCNRVIVAVFDSSAEHDAYQVSPVHTEMKTWMGTFIADIVVCDTDLVPAPIATRGR